MKITIDIKKLIVSGLALDVGGYWDGMSPSRSQSASSTDDEPVWWGQLMSRSIPMAQVGTLMRTIEVSFYFFPCIEFTAAHSF